MPNFIIIEILDNKEIARHEVLYTSPYGAKQHATSKQAYKFNTSSIHVHQTSGGNGKWYKSQKTNWKWVIDDTSLS